MLLPLLLVRIHAVPARAQRNHQQQTTDDRRRLEEVILEEVTVVLVWRNIPERVEIKIHRGEPDHEHERRQLRLVADGDEKYERHADGALHKLQRRHL